MKWEKNNYTSNWIVSNTDELKIELENIKRNSINAFNLNKHYINHYVLSYFLTMICLGFFVVTIFKYNKFKRSIRLPIFISMPNLRTESENAESADSDGNQQS